MTKVVEDRDASLAWQSGWTHEYTIERDDGKQVAMYTRPLDLRGLLAELDS